MSLQPLHSGAFTRHLVSGFGTKMVGPGKLFDELAELVTTYPDSVELWYLPKSDVYWVVQITEGSDLMRYGFTYTLYYQTHFAPIANIFAANLSGKLEAEEQVAPSAPVAPEPLKLFRYSIVGASTAPEFECTTVIVAPNIRAAQKILASEWQKKMLEEGLHRDLVSAFLAEALVIEYDMSMERIVFTEWGFNE